MEYQQSKRQRQPAARKETPKRRNNATRSQQQADDLMSMSLGECQQSQSSYKDCQSPAEDRTNKVLIETPCKQIANLRLNCESQTPKNKKTKAKRKLLSSKSLSQLVPIKFFSKKNSQQKDCTNQNTLKTTQSFPNSAFNFGTENPSCGSHSSNNLSFRQIQSSSLLGLPRQSTENPLSVSYLMGSSSAVNISPIVASSDESSEKVRDIVTLTPNLGPTGRKQRASKKVSKNDVQLEVRQNNDHSANDTDLKDEVKEKSANNKYKSLKNTALVLRDVKNSIGLRMKAKHESKAFAKLTNEIATPPTKLYSPFNIYTPGCKSIGSTEGATSKPVKNMKKQENKTKRKLNLSKGKSNKDKTKQRQQQTKTLDITNDSMTINDSGYNSLGGQNGHDDSMTTNYEGNIETTDKTPKGRIALRYKKHLMQANTFVAFESPAGKLHEAVKDVEQFQQCIEAISLAIQARGQSG